MSIWRLFGKNNGSSVPGAHRFPAAEGGADRPFYKEGLRRGRLETVQKKFIYCISCIFSPSVLY